MEGRVEVRVGKKWGPVCSDVWTAKEALVVCRHLGFGFALYALKVSINEKYTFNLLRLFLYECQLRKY